jgi:hypothetical protein
LQGVVEMFEAAARCDPVPGQQRELRGAVHQRFESVETVVGGDLPDGVHPGMDVERRQALGAAAEIGDSLADLVPHWSEAIRRH